MAEKTKVTLTKGHKGERVWNDQTERQAARRADALADLHGSTVEETDDGFIVNADHFYGKESPTHD